MTSKSSSLSANDSSVRSRPVTQKQIAQRIGVTQQLVALALQNNPNVAETTRIKILAVAEEMGYDRNANRPARALAAARHGTRVTNDIIALIFEAMPNIAPVAMPYFMPLVDGIEIEAGERQLDLFLVRSKATGLPWLIREGLVDGVILLGSHSTVAQISEIGIPVLTLGSHLPETKGITPDDAGGTAITTRHLLELGHRRIAYLGPQLDWPSARARLEGYRRALSEAGFESQLEETRLANVSETDGKSGMERLLERGEFTALVCHNDSIAMGAIRAAQARGLDVPGDLSITGFDDTSAASGFVPAVTSVGFSGVAMGRAAVKMLLDANAKGQHLEFPVELRVHQSSARLR